jgi:hypothetical protein
MGIGKLYSGADNKFLTDINYKIYEKGDLTRWAGELIIGSSHRIDEKEIYMIELENGHKSLCHLKKKVNRVINGLPPRYVYHVTGFASSE